MTKTIKVAVAGAGAFDIKHLDGIENIEGVKVISLVSRDLERTKEVDAVILCTPTQMHAAQTITCLQAGKHVQVEIALADSSKGAQDVVAQAKNSNLVAM